ncbi:MAG: hypothetical protein ACYCVD_02950 [Desulfitobacteriaceae bacterium]
MLRKIIESVTGPMTDLYFRETLDLATDDIRINRVAFGQRTSLREVIQISTICFEVLWKIKKAA